MLVRVVLCASVPYGDFAVVLKSWLQGGIGRSIRVFVGSFCESGDGLVISNGRQA